MRLVDLLCTTRDRVPCATAAIDGESRISYSELASTVSEVAEYLRELGVGPGDVVAISSLNSASYYAALLAINWSGAIIAPVNLRLSPAEVAAQLRWSKPKLAFADDAGVELIEKGAQVNARNEVFISLFLIPDRFT